MSTKEAQRSMKAVMGVRAIRALRMEEAATRRMSTFLFSRKNQRIILRRA